MSESVAASDAGMLVVLGDPVAADLARTLDLAGYRWKAVSSSAEASENEPSNGWAGASAVARADMVEYGDLALNLETYQASIGGRPLDLTYMEYELLKFLAQNPGKVFTREMLLSRVWGYEYYGGARTVDVHVRRLRAKLGEEHAGLIQTVRSVGYRFGQSRWG